MIEANTINLLLLLLTILFNANLLYLCLEGTLSNVLIFYHSKLSTIRRLGIDVLVKIDIKRFESMFEFTLAKMLKKDI